MERRLFAEGRGSMGMVAGMDKEVGGVQPRNGGEEPSPRNEG